MSTLIRYQQITEGSTVFFAPEQQNKDKGPGKKQGLPFYNPAMELNRDVSIAVVQWLLSTGKRKHFLLLDGLAATGVRGIRFSNELSGSFDVIINDWSEESFLVMQKNVKEKSLKNVRCENQNLNSLLLKEKFDYIDVDPFGSPVSFVDAAMKSIHHHGVLAVSATDTAGLCGVYPKVCLRRYAANPLHGPIMHEVGLRILLGFVAREAAKHEVGIQPILSYKTDHYMRLYVQIHRNIPSANKTAKRIQPISKRDVYPFKDEPGFIGPLWTGSLHDKEIIEVLKGIGEKKIVGTKKKMMKLFSLFEEESEAPLFYYTTNELGSLLRCSPPKLEELWETFHQHDLPIFRTQFDPTGFKTPAPFDEVKTLFVKSCKNSE